MKKLFLFIIILLGIYYYFSNDDIKMISNDNKAPINEETRINVDKNSEINFELISKDPEGDPLVYEIIQYPKFGKISGEEPNLIYKPFKDFHGEDSFMFQSYDGYNRSDLTEVKIRVLNNRNKLYEKIKEVERQNNLRNKKGRVRVKKPPIYKRRSKPKTYSLKKNEVKPKSGNLKKETLNTRENISKRDERKLDTSLVTKPYTQESSPYRDNIKEEEDWQREREIEEKRLEQEEEARLRKEEEEYQRELRNRYPEEYSDDVPGIPLNEYQETLPEEDYNDDNNQYSDEYNDEYNNDLNQEKYNDEYPEEY